ncbi:uncharacterized protein CMU_031930 [Cryptosporidium muris RN66]|uniref:ATPase AAA-type core domain-containing protein n=1 Tax=Cryptosporidium muris (strain RN66) TaxID=441375 RepID=B6AIL1_CRYMR|nr:uncharacterized protein CMU_031930 [Cryptosporidium muris RN66]EEA08052.1 hypothetical protein, conserved [Cryptosporidium muris RN66]|eukprot:XP_002142401.1 hypothetical protein [Cryptosporidium muris RN66]
MNNVLSKYIDINKGIELYGICKDLKENIITSKHSPVCLINPDVATTLELDKSSKLNILDLRFIDDNNRKFAVIVGIDEYLDNKTIILHSGFKFYQPKKCIIYKISISGDELLNIDTKYTEIILRGPMIITPNIEIQACILSIPSLLSILTRQLYIIYFLLKSSNKIGNISIEIVRGYWITFYLNDIITFWQIEDVKNKMISNFQDEYYNLNNNCIINNQIISNNIYVKGIIPFIDLLSYKYNLKSDIFYIDNNFENLDKINNEISEPYSLYILNKRSEIDKVISIYNLKCGIIYLDIIYLVSTYTQIYNINKNSLKLIHDYIIEMIKNIISKISPLELPNNKLNICVYGWNLYFDNIEGIKTIYNMQNFNIKIIMIEYWPLNKIKLRKYVELNFIKLIKLYDQYNISIYFKLFPDNDKQITKYGWSLSNIIPVNSDSSNIRHFLNCLICIKKININSNINIQEYRELINFIISSNFKVPQRKYSHFWEIFGLNNLLSDCNFNNKIENICINENKIRNNMNNIGYASLPRRVRLAIEEIMDYITIFNYYKRTLKDIKFSKIINENVKYKIPLFNSYNPRILLFTSDDKNMSYLFQVKESIINIIQNKFNDYEIKCIHILQLISPYVGESEANIRNLFQISRKKKHIIILEGIDLIGAKISYSNLHTKLFNKNQLSDCIEGSQIQFNNNDNDLYSIQYNHLQKMDYNKSNIQLNTSYLDNLKINLLSKAMVNLNILSDSIIPISLTNSQENSLNKIHNRHTSIHDRNLLATLLLCLDSVEKQEDSELIIIATSSLEPKLLEESITRAGRLDIHIQI